MIEWTLWVGPITFVAADLRKLLRLEVPSWSRGNIDPTSAGPIQRRSVQLTSQSLKYLQQDGEKRKKGDLRWKVKTEPEPFLREVGKTDGWDFRLEMLTIQRPAWSYCSYAVSLSAISDGLKYYKTLWGHIMFPNEGKIINPNLMWHSLLPLMSFLHLIIIHNLQSWL